MYIQKDTHEWFELQVVVFRQKTHPSFLQDKVMGISVRSLILSTDEVIIALLSEEM